MADKKKQIEAVVIDKLRSTGMDIPDNIDYIVEYCLEDINAAADPEMWHDGDVVIALRRFMQRREDYL